jgi:hypothetical protein
MLQFWADPPAPLSKGEPKIPESPLFKGSWGSGISLLINDLWATGYKGFFHNAIPNKANFSYVKSE